MYIGKKYKCKKENMNAKLNAISKIEIIINNYYITLRELFLKTK